MVSSRPAMKTPRVVLRGDPFIGGAAEAMTADRSSAADVLDLPNVRATHRLCLALCLPLLSGQTAELTLGLPSGGCGLSLGSFERGFCTPVLRGTSGCSVPDRALPLWISQSCKFRCVLVYPLDDSRIAHDVLRVLVTLRTTYSATASRST